MILIGQYDSPFVRRTAVALHLYGMAYEHRPWSVFGDQDKVAAVNPLTRVPVLLLDSGEALIESAAILDYLDELAGPAQAMMPRDGVVRRHALHICALACGLAEKAVALVYERVLHQQTSEMWVGRLQAQIGGALDALETRRAAIATPYWFGGQIGHADIAVTCAWRFASEAHPALFAAAKWPALAAHAATCETLPAFAAVVQRFIPPN